MRILVIVSRDAAHPAAAGGDCLLTQLSRDLAAGGHFVTLLVASHPSIPRHEVAGNLRVIRLAPSRLFFIAVWSRLLTDLHGEFDVVIEEAVGGERAPFLARVFAGGPTIPFWYQDNRPLFKANYGRMGSAAGIILQRFLLWLNRRGFALCDSNATREWLIREGVGSDRVAVSFPKIDPALAPANPRPFLQRLDRVVTIGNFRPTKRFEDSIRTLARLSLDHPEVELVLLGRPQDDGYLRGLHQLVGELHVGSRVSFHIAASDHEKFNVLSAAKVLTVHSPVEGFGWTIAEAGLCGVPVVGNPGVPTDTLREGINGVRVPFGDVEAYAQAVGRLLVDRRMWESLSIGARNVSLEFANSPVEPRVLELLSRCGGVDPEGRPPQLEQRSIH